MPENELHVATTDAAQASTSDAINRIAASAHDAVDRIARGAEARYSRCGVAPGNGGTLAVSPSRMFRPMCARSLSRRWDWPWLPDF